MSDSTASAVPPPGLLPGAVKALATGFFLVCLAIQIWRLETLSATYDQALFLQELWSTARGRPFESSLSSVLSGAVAVGDALPRVDYLHLGQHANALTLLIAPLVLFAGSWALPVVQVSALTAAGLVLWRIAVKRLPLALALRITVAYYLSGAVIGPALENFHDLIWLPLLGFLVVEALLERRSIQLVSCAVLLLLVREDSGLLLFSLGLWALVRRPGIRWWGAGLMVLAVAWVSLVTGWIQPLVDSSLSDRFLAEKFGHLVADPSVGTFGVVVAMLRNPVGLVQALVSPPGATLGFLLALSLPLLLIPLVSVDAALLLAVPLLVALVSQGRTALAVTLRYVLALVPGLYLGAVLWWEAHPQIWYCKGIRPLWTSAVTLGLILTLVGNPHRSLSAFVPDSFVPWVHVPPPAMLQRRTDALQALSLIPSGASVSADTPLLPRLAQREVAIRFPDGVRYLDRRGVERQVNWVVAFPGFYTPFTPLFKRETNQQERILRDLDVLVMSGDYQRHYCARGLVVLQRVDGTMQAPMANSGSATDCLER